MGKVIGYRYGSRTFYSKCEKLYLFLNIKEPVQLRAQENVCTENFIRKVEYHTLVILLITGFWFGYFVSVAAKLKNNNIKKTDPDKDEKKTSSLL
jgi:hypothetical protein